MASPSKSPFPAPDTPPAAAAATVPDEDPGIDLPMTMSASVLLTNLPKDASLALGEVEELDRGKGIYLYLSPSSFWFLVSVIGFRSCLREREGGGGGGMFG